VERPYALSAAGARRITGTASRWRRRERVVGIVFAAWFVAVAVTINVLRELLDVADAKTASGAVLIPAVVLLFGFLVHAYTTKSLLIDVGRDAIALDGGRRGVFPLAGVRAGVWPLARYDVLAGTVLHLSAGADRFLLGGRDHRPLPGLRLDAPPASIVDGTVTAAQLDVLLAAVPALAVDLEPGGVRVFDAATGAALAAAPRGRVKATPAKHTYPGRGGYTMPMLVLEVPELEAVTVGIPDLRFSWPHDAREVPAATRIVGGADWLTLVDWLGLTPRLVVAKGPA
jgi:hypothetical protein